MRSRDLALACTQLCYAIDLDGRRWQRHLLPLRRAPGHPSPPTRRRHRRVPVRLPRLAPSSTPTTSPSTATSPGAPSPASSSPRSAAALTLPSSPRWSSQSAAVPPPTGLQSSDAPCSDTAGPPLNSTPATVSSDAPCSYTAAINQLQLRMWMLTKSTGGQLGIGWALSHEANLTPHYHMIDPLTIQPRVTCAVAGSCEDELVSLFEDSDSDL
jgi:hypothetical protein